MMYFDSAKDYFKKSRTLSDFSDEHGYFTEIDMLGYRIDNTLADDETKALLNAERHALTFEALRVVPSGRQNLLRDLLWSQTRFKDLPYKDKEIITAHVMSGYASPLLIEYYAQSLLAERTGSKWRQLRSLVNTYWDFSKEDPGTAIVICKLAKLAFLKNADTRLELLRSFFDSLVRYQDANINYVLLAEYIRLISIDALVLEKYDYLRSTMNDIIELFREAKPRFLKDEFVLDKSFYSFDESVHNSLTKMFVDNKANFPAIANATRYQKLVNLDKYRNERYFHIELDPFSQFFIKGLRKQTSARGNVDLSFCIKHTHEGFIATDFRT